MSHVTTVIADLKYGAKEEPEQWLKELKVIASRKEEGREWESTPKFLTDLFLLFDF